MSYIITYLTTLFMQYCPLLIAFADDAAVEATTPGFLKKVLGVAMGIGAAVVAVFMIYHIVKEGIQFAKGQGSSSIWSIIGKVIFLIFLIGLIFVAGNYVSIGKQAQTIGNKSINIINNEVTNMLGQ